MTAFVNGPAVFSMSSTVNQDSWIFQWFHRAEQSELLKIHTWIAAGKYCVTAIFHVFWHENNEHLDLSCLSKSQDYSSWALILFLIYSDLHIIFFKANSNNLCGAFHVMVLYVLHTHHIKSGLKFIIPPGTQTEDVPEVLFHTWRYKGAELGSGQQWIRTVFTSNLHPPHTNTTRVLSM